MEMRLSPAASVTEYREAVLQIAKELQSTVTLIRPEGGIEADKEDPPA
jgi:hypothetical protein